MNEQKTLSKKKNLGSENLRALEDTFWETTKGE